MTITLYGIPNCDTVKKARAWLDAQAIAYTFHDLKKQGITAATLEAALQSVPWDRLINRQGTTWRKLSPAQQAAVSDNASAAAAATANPSLIKRPLMHWADDRWTVGFDALAWRQFCGPSS
jgi:arsenate reductase (glutaredoxin)